MCYENSVRGGLKGGEGCGNNGSRSGELAVNSPGPLSQLLGSIN